MINLQENLEISMKHTERDKKKWFWVTWLVKKDFSKRITAHRLDGIYFIIVDVVC